MLLPSDVARLVLGYLQQEKLPSTCRAFITESSHLKEYADHHTDDGAIPGCLLSLFGKNLTTILNEYITMKAKENQADIPFMMSALWKKLDLTLSQIRCMQESTAFQTNQRARTRKGINDRLRQKMLTSPLAISGSPPVTQQLHPVTQQISTPVLATQYILCPINTPGTSQSVNSISAIGQPAITSSNPTTTITVDTTPTISVAPAQKKLPITATSSPMRRKPDTQRRRRMAPLSGSVAERDVPLDIDTIQGLIDDGFPQMVIENAREKILSNKCLQEKLAENINKILASDSAGQTSTKQGDGTAAEQDASIEEILGLQGGEIHMSEEAIHDILVQTELDPDFQELYDLFACVSSKTPKGTSRDPSSSQTVDAKIGIGEKSKKQDVVEDAHSIDQAANKMESCLSEEETNNTMLDDRSDVETTLKEKADDSTLQQTCVNECTVSGNSKGHRQPSDLVICIENSNSDTAMESSTESNEIVLEVYTQPHDVEMEIISSTNDGTDDCFIVEDAIPQASISPTKLEPINIGLEVSENEESPEMSTSEKLSDKSQQEANKNLATSQPSTIDPHSKTLLFPAPALNCSSTQNENDQPAETSKICPLDKLCNEEKDKQGNENANGISTEKDAELQTPNVNVAPAACHEQKSCGPVMEPCSTGITLPSSSQAVIDPSTIVTLNIITEDFPEDAEINNAVGTIQEENFPTIILSPLVKNQETRRVVPSQNSSSGDLLESSVVGEQCQLLATSTDGSVSTVNIPNGDCTVYAVSGTTSTTDGSVLQLMPSSNSTFAPSNSLFISSCVTSNVPAKQPNIVMLSNSSAPNNKQASLFQTPPRPGSMYTVGQTISPKLSQGSTIILASPVQPMLQGVMSMFPVSLVGQSGSTFQPHQILHVPVAKPVIPKLPLPPKSQKTLPKPAANTGKPLSNPAADSKSRSSILMPRGNEEKNSFSDIQQKPGERSLPEALSAAPKPMEAHRRVLCFDGSSTLLGSNSSSPSNAKSQKDKNDTIQNALTSTEAVSSKINLSKETRKTESSTSSMGKSTRMEHSMGKSTRMESSTVSMGKSTRLEGSTPAMEKSTRVESSMGKSTRLECSSSSMEKSTRLENSTPSMGKSTRMESSTPSMEKSSRVESSMGKSTRVDSSTPSMGKSSRVESSTPSMGKSTRLESSMGKSTRLESSTPSVEKSSSVESSTPSMGKSTRVDISVVQAKDQAGEKRPAGLGGGYGVNKENVLQGGTQIRPAGQMDKKNLSQENLLTVKIGKPSQEPVRKQTSLPSILRRTPQKVSSERVCCTSPLAKQASQLLQDMQFHSPNAKPWSIGDIPRTPGSGFEDKLTDNNSDHTRTPMCRRYSEDGGTPKPMMPPVTPELPTCSPASEAGSENSVNMAAHTLMILSRASIAKAGSSTPVKDNTHQSKPSKSSSKKRKLEDSEEYEQRSNRKELLSPSSLQKRKKIKKHRKKSNDNFPAGMDVEKFLQSLHYDE